MVPIFISVLSDVQIKNQFISVVFNTIHGIKIKFLKVHSKIKHYCEGYCKFHLKISALKFNFCKVYSNIKYWWITVLWKKQWSNKLRNLEQKLVLIQQYSSVQFSHSVMSNSLTSWTVAHQASLPITNSWSLFKLMSIKSVMSSSRLILCHPLLLLLSVFPSIRVFYQWVSSSDQVATILEV